MSLLSLLSLLACPLGLPGETVDPGAQFSAQEDALMVLKEQAGERFELRWQDDLPTGLSLASPVQNSPQGVIDWVVAQDPIFQLSEAPGLSLYLQRWTQDEESGVSSYFFGLSMDGLPILDAELVFTVEKETLTQYSGRYTLSQGRVDLEPTLSARSAQAIAQAQLSETHPSISTAGEVKLVLIDPALQENGEPGGLIQAYRVPLHTLDETEAWLSAYVGTESQSVLRVDATRSEEAFDTQIIDADWSKSSNCWYPVISWARIWEAEQVCDTSGCESGATADARTAYTMNQATWNHLWDTFRRDGYDRWGGEHETIVRVGGPSNAYYDPGCDHTAFSSGNVTHDIVGHEWGHAIDQKTAQLVYADQSGAIDEHLGDIRGVYFRWDQTSTYSSDIGTGSALGKIRDIEDPPSEGDPDHMSGYLTCTAANCGSDSDKWDSAEVHTNSGILNKALSMLIVGGTHPVTSIPVDAVDSQRLYKVMHRAHVSRLRSNATFADYRSAMMAEATHQSWSVQDLCQVNNAFAAVGIGNPDYDCDGVQDVFAGGDVDRDGIPDILDNCPGTANPTQADWDSDGVGNSCDVDYDNDGLDNDVDTCPYDADPTNADSDGDGEGDACANQDGDAWLDTEDGCPLNVDYAVYDKDGDGIWDQCDIDLDGDGIDNSEDVCWTVYDPEQADFDKDGVGDLCGDADGDGIIDQDDACPLDRDSFPLDRDNDGLLDACEDSDDDNDGVPDETDTCPWDYDNDNVDSDGDGFGDVCDQCPTISDTTNRDLNKNGIPDACDPHHNWIVGESALDEHCAVWSSKPEACLDLISPDLDELLIVTMGPWLEDLIHAGEVPGLVPLPACLNDCPDFLSPDWTVTVHSSVDANHQLLVLDDRGRIVAKATPPMDQSMAEQSVSFQPGAGARSVVNGQIVSDQSFWLAVVPDTSFGGQPYGVQLSIETGVPELK